MSGGSQGVIARIDNAGQYFQVSDATAKEEIAPLGGALEKVRALQGYTYRFRRTDSEKAKGQETTPAAGLLAQELAQVLPEAVSEADGRLFVNYSAIIPVLVEALKEQQGELEAHRRHNDELQAALAALTARIEALERGNETGR